MAEGLNPVTFTGVLPDGLEFESSKAFCIQGFLDRSEREQINVTVGRLHISAKQRSSGQVQEGQARMKAKEELDKLVTVVLWQEPEKILAHAVIDEDHLIQGLQYLFPHRELEK